MRSRWQKQGKLWKVKEMGNKEQRVMNEKNHKLAREIMQKIIIVIYQWKIYQE